MCAPIIHPKHLFVLVLGQSTFSLLLEQVVITVDPYECDNHTPSHIAMDLNTTFELVFGILATLLAIIAIWLAVSHRNRSRCMHGSLPMVFFTSNANFVAFSTQQCLDTTASSAVNEDRRHAAIVASVTFTTLA